MHINNDNNNINITWVDHIVALWKRDKSENSNKPIKLEYEFSSRDYILRKTNESPKARG